MSDLHLRHHGTPERRDHVDWPIPQHWEIHGRVSETQEDGSLLHVSATVSWGGAGTLYHPGVVGWGIYDSGEEVQSQDLLAGGVEEWGHTFAVCW